MLHHKPFPFDNLTLTFDIDETNNQYPMAFSIEQETIAPYIAEKDRTLNTVEESRGLTTKACHNGWLNNVYCSQG